MMNRRHLFSAFSVLPALGVPQLGTSTPQQQIALTAPGEVTVLTIPVSNGQVKQGDTVATLSSIQLTRYQAMLNIYSQTLAIEQRPFSDGRVDQLVQLTQAEAAAAQTAFNESQSLANAQQLALSNGFNIQDELTASLIQVEDRRVELAAINNEVAQLPQKIQDAKDRLALASQQLAAQNAALAALVALLTVKAPVNGLFVASVGLGGFVKKGDPIGVLYL